MSTEQDVQPGRLFVDRLHDQILVVAEPYGAIVLDEGNALRLANDLRDEVLHPAANSGNQAPA